MLIDQDRAAKPTHTAWRPSHTRRTILTALLLAASGIPLMEQAAAADASKIYPNRPIRLIVPQTAGSALDTLARIFAIRMSEALGQHMVVDNRGGAGGTIGAGIVAQPASPKTETMRTGVTKRKQELRRGGRFKSFSPSSGSFPLYAGSAHCLWTSLARRDNAPARVPACSP